MPCRWCRRRSRHFPSFENHSLIFPSSPCHRVGVEVAHILISRVLFKTFIYVCGLHNLNVVLRNCRLVKSISSRVVKWSATEVSSCEPHEVVHSLRPGPLLLRREPVWPFHLRTWVAASWCTTTEEILPARTPTCDKNQPLFSSPQRATNSSVLRSRHASRTLKIRPRVECSHVSQNFCYLIQSFRNINYWSPFLFILILWCAYIFIRSHI